MATPTFAQLRNLSSNAAGLTAESTEERILTLVCILSSQQNPDGTAYTMPTVGSGRTHTPTYTQYRTLSSALSSSAGGRLWNAEGIRERMLTCLAAYVSGQNPDGTQVGT